MISVLDVGLYLLGATARARDHGGIAGVDPAELAAVVMGATAAGAATVATLIVQGRPGDDGTAPWGGHWRGNGLALLQATRDRRRASFVLPQGFVGHGTADGPGDGVG